MSLFDQFETDAAKPTQAVFDAYKRVRNFIDGPMVEARERLIQRLGESTGADKELVAKTIKAYRAQIGELKGWMPRKHGEGVHQVNVYHTIRSLPFVARAIDGGHAATLPFYAGKDVQREIRKFAREHMLVIHRGSTGAPIVIASDKTREKIQEAIATLEGRYCLNDLHKAAGGEKKHGPSYWLTNAQTKELISELNKGGTGIPGGPLTTVNDGFNNGTYVVKELVYAYAMWISPKFHLKVIRTFDAVVNQASAPAIHGDPVLMLAQATQMLRQEQLAMQEQVAALETKTEALDARTEGLEISASSLKHQTAHLHDRAFDLDDKTDRLGKETRSLGCKTNKMEADIAGISDGLRLAQRQVRDIQSRPTPPLTLRAPSNPITVRIHNKGLTVRGWAKQNGFKYSSVRNVISGITSKQVIVKAMSRDGLLEDESGDLF